MEKLPYKYFLGVDSTFPVPLNRVCFFFFVLCWLRTDDCLRLHWGTFLHYSNIYSFGRAVAQRLRVVDTTEQYKLKNNRMRQFERHPAVRK